MDMRMTNGITSDDANKKIVRGWCYDCHRCFVNDALQCSFPQCLSLNVKQRFYGKSNNISELQRKHRYKITNYKDLKYSKDGFHLSKSKKPSQSDKQNKQDKNKDKPQKKAV